MHAIRVAYDPSMQGVMVYHYDATTQEHGTLIPPLCLLAVGEAQLLVDDLWRAGIRPTEGKVSDKTLEAKVAHIEDLRTILWRVLPSAVK